LPQDKFCRELTSLCIRDAVNGLFKLNYKPHFLQADQLTEEQIAGKHCKMQYSSCFSNPETFKSKSPATLNRYGWCFLKAFIYRFPLSLQDKKGLLMYEGFSAWYP